jgi:hypothetical protein
MNADSSTSTNNNKIGKVDQKDRIHNSVNNVVPVDEQITSSGAGMHKVAIQTLYEYCCHQYSNCMHSALWCVRLTHAICSAMQ